MKKCIRVLKKEILNKSKIMEGKTMKEKNRLQEQKAITLIALVITIVVMLILAGVTINLTLGQNGIFTTAQKAAQNYTQAQNQEMADLTSFTNVVDKLASGGMYYATDNEGNTIPVPTGFSPITTSDQGTKYTGFVIKNDTDGNEFVWVPVEGRGYTYNRYAMLASQPEWELDSDTQSMKIKHSTSGSYYYSEKMPEDERISVETYGGYYIGRYEAGIVGGTKGNTKTNGTYYTGENMKLVVKSGQQVWNFIEQGRALKEATNLYNKENNNVTSKLCSSYAWDTALKFMESTGSAYPTNSVGGYYGKSSPTTTGYDTAHPCNIYDMAGNVWEWTTESSGAASVLRGGRYSGSASANPASYRSSDSTTSANDSITFRVALFM